VDTFDADISVDVKLSEIQLGVYDNVVIVIFEAETFD
jgi:hypothetical protein